MVLKTIPLRLILLFFLVSTHAFCQEEFLPVAAPKIDAFSLSPDNIGRLDNSVNLFTGDVSIPLNLVSIGRRDDAGIDVGINYNSNIQNQVGIWNYEAPTSVAGLGWSFEYPMIMSDNKQTGTREDDSYYFIGEGTSSKLILVASDASSRTYKFKGPHDWLVTFFPAAEKWEITKENGSKLIFGDLGSGRNTLQRIVTWGNWIGNSAQTTGQETQVLIWNLSEIDNIFGDKVFYTYQEETQQVGAGGLAYTRASYVSKIHNTLGDEVQFQYAIKSPDECPDPHTENGINQPDGYQDRFERFYLNKLSVLNNRITPATYYEVKLNYNISLLGTGYLTKRLLTSISKYEFLSGKSMNEIYFDYLTSTAMRGALYKVRSSLGGTITYDYHTGLDITKSARQKTSAVSVMNNAWVNGDYAFSLINTGGLATMSLYSWEGRWKASSQETITGTVLMQGTTNLPDVSVTMQNDFFAVFNHNNQDLYIFRKSDSEPGGWTKYTTTLSGPNSNMDHPEGAWSGENFVAIRSGDGDLVSFVFDGTTWVKQQREFLLAESANTTAGVNFIVSHHSTVTGDKFYLYTLNEKKEWSSRYILPTVATGNNGGKSWSSSNTFAAGLINGNIELLSWDKSYNLTSSRFYHNINQYGTYVFISDGSSMTFVDRISSNLRSLRFNGSGWHDTFNRPYQFSQFCSIGSDVIGWMQDATNDPVIARFRYFNPTSLAWSTETVVTMPKAFPAPTPNGIPRVIGNGFMLVKDRYYLRKADGTWTNDANFSYTGISNLNGGSFAPGNNFVAYVSTVSGNGRLNMQFFKNGALANLEYSTANTGNPFTHKFPGTINEYLTVGSTMVTTGGGLYKALNYKFEGPLQDYPVIRITINDGTQDRYTSYLYDGTKAVYDPTGTVAQYNKITVIPGSSTTSSKPFGYTEQYFYNDLTEAELATQFPAEVIGQGSQSRMVTKGNGHLNLKLVTGSIYTSRVFNSTSTLVAETNTFYQVDGFDVYAGAAKVDKIYAVRKVKTVTTKDGIQAHIEYEYKPNSLQLASQRTYVKTQFGFKNEIKVEYMYAWEIPNSIGAAIKSANILSPLAQVKRSSLSGTTASQARTYIDCQTTRWKLWSSPRYPGGIPLPYDNFTWKGEGSVDFSEWDPSVVPSSLWEYKGKISSRDYATGIPLDQESAVSRPSAQIYDQNLMKVVASADNATYNQIAFSSFEDGSFGNFDPWVNNPYMTDGSKTGARNISLGNTGITRSGLTSSNSYTLSFWAKSSGGSVNITSLGTKNLGNLTEWTPFTYTITGVSSITINRLNSTEVRIDELRLYPSNAMMYTSTHHPVYGVTSQTDINDQTVYTEYDEFGRISILLDKNRNIVKAYSYNIKK